MGYYSKMIWTMAFAALVSSAAYGAFDDVTVEKYPDADAVLVEGVCDTAYKPDGTYSSETVNTVKILTEKGRRDESEIELGYSARYGSAEVVSVSVVAPDGTEREVDVSKTTKETTDNSSAAENIYDTQHRKVVCTVPGLKVGDVIRYKTRRSVFKSRVKDSYSDISVLEWKSPIVRQVVRVKAPKELPIKCMAVRYPLGNVEYKAEELGDGSTLHVWTATNSPQAFDEPDTPPFYTLIQSVRISTAEDWPTLSRWYWDLCQDHLAKTTEAITNRVNEIMEPTSPDDPAEKRIGAVYKWVSQEIRYMGLTMEDTSPGYAPHDVSITFDNRYGVCRDKAALLVAMLRIAGFEAYPVLIHVGAKMDEEVPMPYFNHAIAAVRAPGDPAANKDGFILMDPTNESSADLCPAYLGDKSYLVATPWGEKLHLSPVFPADANSVKVKGKAELQRDGSMVVESVADFSGINDNVYRQALLRRKPEDRRRMFERIVSNAAAGAELLSFEMWPKDLRETESLLRVKLLYRVSEAVLKGENRDELTVPFLTRVLGSANWILDGGTSLEKRRFPLVVDSTAKTEETVEVDLGGALGGKASVPDPVEFDGPYAYSRSYSIKDGVLVARRVHAVNAVEFSPAQYLELREGIKRVEAADRPRPAFSKNPYADANVRVLRSAMSYNVTSPTSWVVTNVVEKEVLTYDGKKRSSELKFAFNPTWKDVELVSAVVSNRDGRVSAVGEREKSLFDCEWSGAAPRYPASKELVVNLPSVEIGSVISYTTVTTVTNAPAPFRTVWVFDVTEPTDELSVDYRDWKGGSFSRTVRNPKKIPSEPMQPNYLLWRDVKTVSHGDIAEVAANLRPAADVKPVKACEALDAAAKCKTPEERIEAVRGWMAKHVRVAGPSLYEVPLAMQLTDPKTVLEERYGTRLDYIRTLCAVLRGAGLDASVVFAASDAFDDLDLRWRPFAEGDARHFSLALCRVNVKKGGFLCWGGSTTTYYLGTENEYSPLGPSHYAASSFIDPAPGSASTKTLMYIEGAALKYPSKDRTCCDISVRENGAVDFDYASELYGPGVGSFRKKYAEMLPEDRSRHFQQMLGGIAQAASATRELATDVEGYPAKLSFSAYVPDYATVSGDAITLVLPEIGSRIFALTGSSRETPLGVPAVSSDEEAVVKVTFPEGYTEIEHLPDAFSFVSPDGKGVLWRSLDVKSEKNADGRLVVMVTQFQPARIESVLQPEYFALLKDFSRISSSRANRTIVVTKPGATPKKP